MRKLGYRRQLINYLHGFHRDADELLDEVDYIAGVLRILVGVVDDAGALSIFTWLTIDHPFQRASTVDGVALSVIGDSVMAYVPVLLHVSISK